MGVRPASCTLIIATYNWPQALEKSIKSVFYQTILPTEIIIADDGSTKETKILIEALSKESPVKIIHVWHEDNGFRLSEIRNKAIAAATGEYIIQIDGDIILHKNFIQDHLNMATPSVFLSGSRISMPSQLSQLILDTNNPKFNRSALPFGYILNSIRLPFLGKFLSTIYKRNQPSIVRGCNMSFWKKDLLAVNGYNTVIIGWGKEDSELAIRLINNGVKKHMLKFLAIAYHLYHKENNKENTAQNEHILKTAILQKTTRVPYGIINDIEPLV